MPVTKLPKNTLVEAIRGAAQRMQQPTDDNVLKAQLLGFLGNILENQLPTEAEQILPMPAAMVVAPRLPRIANPIRAYHGSPHDFDQFSLSKIGTGEGAQAYGHGLYFAENPSVAQMYKETLGDNGMHFPGGEQRQFSFGTPEEIAQDALKNMGAGDRGMDSVYGAASKYLQDLIDRGYGLEHAGVEKRKAALEILKEWQRKGATYGPIGRMYEVNIHANPEDFLDWDKPLSQQSEKVRQALAASPHDDLQLASTANYTGRQAYEGAAHRRGVRWEGPEQAAASQRFKEMGIPGIKYLDQGSRAAGKGTHNYVVFDDRLIDVVKKYGIAAAVGAGLINEGQARQLQAQGYE